MKVSISYSVVSHYQSEPPQRNFPEETITSGHWQREKSLEGEWLPSQSQKQESNSYSKSLWNVTQWGDARTKSTVSPRYFGQELSNARCQQYFTNFTKLFFSTPISDPDKHLPWDLWLRCNRVHSECCHSVGRSTDRASCTRDMGVAWWWHWRCPGRPGWSQAWWWGPSRRWDATADPIPIRAASAAEEELPPCCTLNKHRKHSNSTSINKLNNHTFIKWHIFIFLNFNFTHLCT